MNTLLKVSVLRLKKNVVLFFIAVVLSSIAVAVAGAIAFIGLMGPHIAKSIIGPRHQLFYQFQLS